jgi:pimeloyl-ACP methyl ester carboxylesterase
VQPETRYTWLGQDRIAYQVLGQGPPDLVLTAGSFTHVDTMWENPAVALVYRRLASFARLIRFDRVGTGASDPAPLDYLPPWESYAEELAAVLDEIGSERAAIFVSVDAGSMAMYFAATKPERTSALMLFNTTARYLFADDYPSESPTRLLRRSLAGSISYGARRRWRSLRFPAAPVTSGFAAGTPSCCAAPPVPGPLRPSYVP